MLRRPLAIQTAHPVTLKVVALGRVVPWAGRAGNVHVAAPAHKPRVPPRITAHQTDADAAQVMAPPPANVTPSPDDLTASRAETPDPALPPAPAQHEAEEAVGVREAALEDIEGVPLRLPTPEEWHPSLELGQRPYALDPLAIEFGDLPQPREDIEFHIAVFIDRKGVVVSAQAVGRDDGYAVAVIDAISKVRFTPGILHGSPVPTVMVLWFGLAGGR
ncbi:hypothetical protein GCM10025771_40570 [Niveibacterium umoris]